MLLNYLAFWTSKYLVLFEVIFLLKFISLYTLVYYLVLLTKLTCVNLAVKFSAANLLNFWVVKYLEWSRFLFSTSLFSVLRTVAVTKQLVSGILFTT